MTAVSFFWMHFEGRRLTTTEAVLIRRAVGGDRDALEQLLEQHCAAVRRAIAPRMPQRWRSLLEVDDVLQVTYLEAFRKISEFGSMDSNAFAAWLCRIAEHNLTDAIRELEAQKRPDARKQVHAGDASDSFVSLFDHLLATSTTPSKNVRKGERRELLEQAIQRLPRDYRRVIEWIDLQGRDVHSVATELGRSPGSVYMLRSRAHDSLRDSLDSKIEMTQ